MSASLRAFVTKALERNRISFGDLRRLQHTVLPHGLLTREQAEVLIALDQTIARTDKAWAGYLVAALTDFVVWRSSSPGRVEPETAAWLVASLSCGRPTRTTGMIARAIVREARHCEEPLLSFALSSPKRPSPSSRSIVGAGAESRDPAGPFTVFAPTNGAFAKLPAGTVEFSMDRSGDHTAFPSSFAPPARWMSHRPTSAPDRIPLAVKGPAS